MSIERLNPVQTDENLQIRLALEAQHGKVWSTKDMTSEFKVEGFLSPYVSVVRRSDGVSGSLQFTHAPRFYFDFQGQV